MMRTSNPALRSDTFTRYGRAVESTGNTMTVSGAVNKTGFLLILVLLGASWTWSQTINQESLELSPIVGMTVFISMIVALIVSLIIIFKQTTAPYLSPVYALAEGALIGAISAYFEMRFGGIVVQAVLGTFGTLFALLFAYRSGLIKATENFKLGVMAATGGLALIYLLTFILRFFGVQVPFIHDSGIMGIGFSLFACAVAALNLVLDFDFIEHGEASRAPKYMEWYAAFGLLVTLIWLYLEILRLLAKSRKK